MKIILFLLTFSMIIIIHELGHFLLAKRNGIGVTEFSLGMGPRIVSFVRKETRYSVKLLPFGGSCMMVGEDNMGENVDAENAFNSKSVGARISVILAGPVFNFILAFLLAILVLGVDGVDIAKVTEVSEEAGAVGLQEGDIITKINGEKITFSRELYYYFYLNPVDENPIELTVKRNGEKVKLTIPTTKVEKYLMGCGFNEDASIASLQSGYDLVEQGAKVGDVLTKINDTVIKDGTQLGTYLKEHPLTGEPVTIELQRENEILQRVVTPKLYSAYLTGFDYNYASEKVSFGQVIKYSYAEVRYYIKTTIQSLGMLITGKVSPKEISGPVGVVNVMNDIYDSSIEHGFGEAIIQLLGFSIWISANLGVMNLLPIPALDGGRLVFLIIEGLRGKPIDREKEGMVHLIGFAALMVLMVLVLYNDIMNIFR